MGSMLIRDFLRGGVWGAFKDYLCRAKSHRNNQKLSRSSINTYHSSIKMFLLTYMYDETTDAFWNGFIDLVLKLEREHGNNANFSMQQCAIRHFLLYMKPHVHETISPLQNCPRCLRTACDDPNGSKCVGVVRCFGKCSKLTHSVNEYGICAYCVTKYPIQYGVDVVNSSRRRRHLEYVHDHALIGRTYDPAKHDKLIKRYILEALRWRNHMN